MPDIKTGDTDEAPQCGPIWLTPHQRRIDLLCLDLLEHPRVKRSRSHMLERFRACPEFAVRDAPSTIEAAVDGLLFSCLQLGVNLDPSRPGVVWIVRKSYRIGDRVIPVTGQGADNPDRVYRLAGVDPRYGYQIRGRLHPTHPSSGRVCFEAVRPPGLYGQPLLALQEDQIDVSEAGAFVVTADGTPADGRRNHLHLPPGTQHIVIRDTLLDWGGEIPYDVDITRVDGEVLPERTHDQLAEDGAAMFEASAEVQLIFMQACLREQGANVLSAFERPVKWGMGGGLFALNRFELTDEEALIVRVDRYGAETFNISVTDPWTASVDYARHVSCMNHVQAQVDDDGCFTFVVAPRDPGVYNWLSTGGLHTGAVCARWDPTPGTQLVDVGTDPDYGASRPFAPERAVRGAIAECRVVKLEEVPSQIPPGQSRVAEDERKELQAVRHAEHLVRVTGVPLARD